MKQAITVDQYHELTEEERHKFIEWTTSKGQHAVTVRSIGHLIWFLNDHIETLDGWWAMNKSRHTDVWSIESKYDVGFGNEDRPELVDTLWDAVKSVLRSNTQ